jgi:hypothetical protein
MPSAELTVPLAAAVPSGLSPRWITPIEAAGVPALVKLETDGAPPLIQMRRLSWLADGEALKSQAMAMCTQVPAANAWAEVSTDLVVPVLSLTSKSSPWTA